MLQGRRRVASFAIVAVGLGLLVVFTNKVPHDQSVRIVLGDAAPRVTEVHVRYAERTGKAVDASTEWLREATFQYALSKAPRVVSHEPRLADGDYVVEIDVQSGEKPATIERRVTLSGGTTSLDVSQAIPK